MNGRSYGRKVKLADPIHFASESVEMVIEMFTEAFASGPSLTMPEPGPSIMETPQRSASEDSATGPPGLVSGPSSSLVNNVARAEGPRGPSTEDTSFRYVTFDEWQTGRVTHGRYTTVEAPRWLCWIYEKCADSGLKPVIHNPPLETRAPMFINDQRFAARQRDKIFVCDGCQYVVYYSSVKRNTGSRACYTFAGSYVDNSWALTIPGECLHEAWTHGIIDCTWHCSLVCKAPVTGAGKDRYTRPAKWRQRTG